MVQAQKCGLRADAASGNTPRLGLLGNCVPELSRTQLRGQNQRWGEAGQLAERSGETKGPLIP